MAKKSKKLKKKDILIAIPIILVAFCLIGMLASFAYFSFYLTAWPVIGGKSPYSLILFIFFLIFSGIIIKLITKHINKVAFFCEYFLSSFLPVAVVYEILPENDNIKLKFMIIGLPISFIANFIIIKITKKNIFSYVKYKISSK